MALIDNLVAYWDMGEASGNAIDVHDDNDLTETNGTIGSAAGKVGNCRDFEAGDTEYFTLADNADLSTGDIDFTWQVWFNAETLANFPVLFNKGVSSGTREYVLFYNTSTSRLNFIVQGTAGAESTAVANNAGALSTGTWYCVHCWHDSVNNEIGIAVNAGTPDTDPHTAGVLDGAGAFSIGSSPSQSLYFDGLIDEVGFWKRVLTSGERTSLYNSGNGLAYPFDGGATVGPRRLPLLGVGG